MISVLQRSADQRRPPPSTVISTFSSVGVGEQPLFRRRALPAKRAALPNRKLLAELRFHQPCERQVEVVAAEQQVPAHRGAGEVDAVAFARDADQREVAGAAADVADQHVLPVEQHLLRPREIVRDPGIERRGRLFEQRQLLDARLLRGLAPSVRAPLRRRRRER